MLKIFFFIITACSCSMADRNNKNSMTPITHFDIQKWKDSCIKNLNTVKIESEDTNFFNQIRPYVLNLITSIDTAIIQNGIDKIISTKDADSNNIAFLYYTSGGEFFSDYYSFFIKKPDTYYCAFYSNCGAKRKTGESNLKSIESFYSLINQPNQGTKYYSKDFAILTTIKDGEMVCTLLISPSEGDINKLNKLILQCSE